MTRPHSFLSVVFSFYGNVFLAFRSLSGVFLAFRSLCGVFLALGFHVVFFLLLGHYVVVCGHDLKKKKIFYKNPSYDEGKHFLCQNYCKGSLIPIPQNFKVQCIVIIPSQRCYSFIIDYV